MLKSLRNHRVKAGVPIDTGSQPKQWRVDMLVRATTSLPDPGETTMTVMVRATRAEIAQRVAERAAANQGLAVFFTEVRAREREHLKPARLENIHVRILGVRRV